MYYGKIRRALFAAPLRMKKNLAAPVRSRAIVVLAGILTSRVFGVLRVSLVARYLGIGAHADVLRAGFGIPNLLQNLLGEGALSAAFIPVYSRMLKEGRPEDAGRFAGSIFGLLVAVVSVTVLLGMALAHPICWVLLRGFAQDAAAVAEGTQTVDRLALTVTMVRLAFPMAGLLVLSAWALGILNSHRRFLLPYLAPVAWNVAIIGALLVAGSLAGINAFESGGLSPERFDLGTLTIVLRAAYLGGLAGGLLQFLVQLPLVARVIKGFRISWSTHISGVRTAIRAAGPAIAGRGVAQVSAYLDLLLASFLAVGALAALRYAQVLYLLPVSLFGMSVAAAELPELSRIGKEDVPALAQRLRRGLRQGLFLAVPTAVGYIALGYLLIGGLYRAGLFGTDGTWLCYGTLVAYSLGLLATTCSRLMQNAFWALGDTKKPAQIALVRLVISTLVAVPTMLFLDRFSVDVFLTEGTSLLYFGAVGLAIGSAAAAWTEFSLLRRTLVRRVREPIMTWRAVGSMLLLAAIAALPALGLWSLIAAWSGLIKALLTVAVFAGAYLGLAWWQGRPELNAWTSLLKRPR